MQDNHRPALTPLGGLQSLITKVLIAAAVCEVVYIYMSSRFLRFAYEVESGEFSRETLIQQGESIDSAMLFVGIAYAATYLIAFLLGGVWTYRAARNAALIAPNPARISPGWAVGWHFIPFANLFKPYQAIREIYNSSISAERPLTTPLPKLFIIWWLTFLGSNYLSTISVEFADNGTLDGMKTSSFIDFVTLPISLVALWLWHTIVLAISNAQDRGITPIPEISSTTPGSPQGGING